MKRSQRAKMWMMMCLSLLVAWTARGATPATGPLQVNRDNPRYFTDGAKMPDGSLRAVYLTGSHTWHNLQDAGRLGGPVTKTFDYDGYLDLLTKLHHNFMRMWAWEGGAWWYQGGENDEYYVPIAYSRAGPGAALDGKPKFDLSHFNPEYFDRLRARVIAARDKGIYVSVMLFQGWSIYNHDYGNPWPLHPFNRANNINGIDGDPDKDGEGKEVHTLQAPAVTRLQEAYVRKVIDTLNDLDNVLYEITNETAIFSREWQYHMVRYIKEYEASKPKQHPVGMTAFDSGREGSMKALLDSPADWISPQNDGVSGDYQDDPPAADGRKIIISDTDHLWGVGGDRAWVWKSFTRGHHPIYMDPLGKPDWVRSSEAEMEGARKAMGDTRRFADRMNLAAMTPRNDLASTRYCLASPGKEYLVYQPRAGSAFTVELDAGTYRYEWFNPVQGKTAETVDLQASGGSRQFEAPFDGDAVLYLQAVKLSKEVELYHWVDFPIEAPGAATGLRKWDVEGSCTWTHENGAVRRISLLWYSGSGDTYVYRFGGSLPGRWTGTTSSPVPALNGLELTVKVTPSSNPKRTGWSGQRADQPTAWAHQQGPDGELAKRTPILIMMPDVQQWFNDPAGMRAFVAEFNDNHGFNGGHISTIGRSWFEIGSTGNLGTAPAAPDVRTFAALEAAASEWSERGGWLHLWMWGKGSSGDFSNLPGGYNGAQSRRINRYIAARLGPVPGWSMGLGWDVEFWVDQAKLTWWLDDLIPQLGGWHHWIGHRYSDSDIGRGRDPEPANKGEYLSRGIAWNTLRAGHEQYAGWEHWFTVTSDNAIDAGLAAVPDRPMMSEDRFRQRQSNWPQKDLRSDDATLKEIPRWATRGVAAIYGRLFDSSDGGSDPWPNKAAIKAVIESVDESCLEHEYHVSLPSIRSCEFGSDPLDLDGAAGESWSCDRTDEPVLRGGRRERGH